MADAGPSDETQTQTETPFITPVIGILSNEDAPVMFPAKKRVQRDGGEAKAGGERPGERKAAKANGGIKRKQSDRSESDEEVGADSTVSSEELGSGRSLRSGASATKQERGSGQATNVLKAEDSGREDLGGEPLRKDLSTHFVSRLNRQPIVLLDTLPVASEGVSESGAASKSPRAQRQPQRRPKSPGKPDSTCPASDNKE